MISEEWFQDNYPEWVNSNDEDMCEAREAAVDAIRPALFCLDGRLTRCLRVRMKEFLTQYGVDVKAYDADYYRSGGVCTDEFVFQLGLIHLARHLIMKHKKEFHVWRSWDFCDGVKVYADDTDDAFSRAKAIRPPAHGLKSLGEVILENKKAAS